MKKIIQSYIKLKSKFKPKNDFEFENANYNRFNVFFIRYKIYKVKADKKIDA